MPRSYRHLEMQERALIETQLVLGMRPAVIAAGLRRAPSTVTREILRNGWRAAPKHFSTDLFVSQECPRHVPKYCHLRVPILGKLRVMSGVDSREFLLTN